MISAELQNQFNEWLDRALAKPVANDIIAFSFNLFEPWSIELVGARFYSETDEDWACPPEAFRAKVKKFRLPNSEVGDTWQSALEGAKALIAAYLDRPSSGSERLKQAQAVVAGFVDGNLDKVWPT